MRSGFSYTVLCAGAVSLLSSSVGLSSAGADPVTEAFDFTGSAQQFVVPDNVCQVTVDAYGAEGGEIGGSIVAGFGGRATATIDVTPGETLAVYVGGSTADEFGGFNGGGDAGLGTVNMSAGLGGGGASDVRQGGTALADRVVVAGGGGGRSNGGAEGGDGGGETGVVGGGPFGGEGGTQSMGGAPTGPANGQPGTLGAGGRGADDTTIAGGGGGGGLYGGAGGSSDPNNADSGGGGGGSGFGPPGTVFETGVRDEDGMVEITYDADAGTCGAPDEVPVGPVAAEPTLTG